MAKVAATMAKVAATMAKVAAALVTSSMILSACASSTGKIEIRPLGRATAPGTSTADQVAYGRSQLALGSTGLALESFRKALRQQPEDAEALRGLGDSYAAMGRQDLARRYYEEALAMAPQDPILLRAVDSLADVAGPAPAPSPGESAQVSPSPQATPRSGPVVPGSAAIAAVAKPGASRNLQAGPSVGSITVKLPPARPYEAATPERRQQPRLERLSTGEVALVTTAKPIWQALAAPRALERTAARSLPRRTASAQVPIRLLNAARYQGLAARTRRLLAGHGWRRLQIGDAPRVHAKSAVLYPEGSEAVARILAAKLRVHTISVVRGGTIVVLLGRDSARATARQIRA